MQILQQHRNIALSFNIQAAQSHTKPTDISKFITGHFIALQREEIQLYPPEHQHKLPQPGNLDSHLSNPTHSEEPPQYRRTTDCQNTERPPQTQQYNKMKRQRNTQQVKEQDNAHQTKQKRKR